MHFNVFNLRKTRILIIDYLRTRINLRHVVHILVMFFKNKITHPIKSQIHSNTEILNIRANEIKNNLHCRESPIHASQQIMCDTYSYQS